MLRRFVVCLFTAALSCSLAVPALGGEFSESLGRGLRNKLGDFRKGFSAEGEKRAEVPITLSEESVKAGLAVNAARQEGFRQNLGLEEGITCYVVSSAPFRGRLVARALDDKGSEQGRALVPVTLVPNVGKNISFRFDSSLPTDSISQYRMDIEPSAVQLDVASDIKSGLGLELSQVEEPTPQHPGALVAYAVAEKAVSARLIAQAFDAAGKELERSQIAVRMNPGDGASLSFPFTARAEGAAKFTLNGLAGSGLSIKSGDSLAPLGLEVSRSKDQGLQEGGVRIISYIIANKAFSGRIIAKALDRNGGEIGRGTVRVEFPADDARELAFDLPAHLDAQEIDSFIIEAVKESAPQGKAG